MQQGSACACKRSQPDRRQNEAAIKERIQHPCVILFIVLPLFEKGVGQIAGIRNSSQSIRLRLLESEMFCSELALLGHSQGSDWACKGSAQP